MDYVEDDLIPTVIYSAIEARQLNLYKKLQIGIRSIHYAKAASHAILTLSSTMR